MCSAYNVAEEMLDKNLYGYLYSHFRNLTFDGLDFEEFDLPNIEFVKLMKTFKNMKFSPKKKLKNDSYFP